MNATNLRATAKLLRETETYDQRVYSHKTCGSPACIAGHACTLVRGYELFGPTGDSVIDGKPRSVWDVAGEFLGLDHGARDDLFFAHFDPDDPEQLWPEPFGSRFVACDGDHKAEAQVAADYLDHLADQADTEDNAK